jgi:hypothetical protein
MSLNESIDVENGGEGTHRRRTGEELLRFPRASIILSDSDRHEENPNATDGGAGENHEEEISPAYSVSGGALTATSRQRKPNNCRFRRREHGPLRAVLRSQDRSITPASTSRQVMSSRSRRLPELRTHAAAWPGSTQTFSPGTKGCR